MLISLARARQTCYIALHHEHDLKTNLKDGTSSPLGATYSLSSSKLSSYYEFLDDYLAMDFIHPSSSTHATLVLFVHKKDGSLCLCVDFQGLNKVTNKDTVDTHSHISSASLTLQAMLKSIPRLVSGI